MKYLIVILPLILTGCVAPWSKQDYAGITYFEADACDPVIVGDVALCHLLVIDGKEGSRDIEVAKNPDGSFSLKYGAETLAFPAFVTRAGVEIELANILGDVSPEIVQAIISAVTGVPVQIPEE